MLRQWLDAKNHLETSYDRTAALIGDRNHGRTRLGFYSLDLEGVTGIGHSIEDCLDKAKWGMKEHMELLKEQHLPVPAVNPDPEIVIQNTKNHAPVV